MLFGHTLSSVNSQRRYNNVKTQKTSYCDVVFLIDSRGTQRRKSDCTDVLATLVSSAVHKYAATLLRLCVLVGLRFYICVTGNCVLNSCSYVRVVKQMNRVMGNQPLYHMRIAMLQARLRIRAVSPEPMLFAHVSRRPRESFSERTGHVALLRDRS